MRFAAFGRTHWLYDSIRACTSRGHEIALIGTCEAAPEYRVGIQDFRRLAQELSCPFFADAAINKPDKLALAENSGAEIAISINWLTLIGAQMLAQFPHGIVNAHCGDLPRFRGNACPNWAILSGEPRMTVSLHRMTAELDAGDVFLQRHWPIAESTYIRDLYGALDCALPEMFADLLDGLEDGTISPRPQSTDPADSLRCFPRIPADGFLDWNRPAEELCRVVRASSDPFAGAYTYLEGQKLIVWRATAGGLEYPHLGVPGQVVRCDEATRRVGILCREGVLDLELVQLADQGRRAAFDVLRSTRQRLGMSVPNEIQQLRARVSQLEEVVRKLTEAGGRREAAA